MDDKEKDNLTEILKNKLIDCSGYRSDEHLYSMYIYLTTTITELDSSTIYNHNAFLNLMFALKRPVLCIEVIETIILLFIRYNVITKSINKLNI